MSAVAAAILPAATALDTIRALAPAARPHVALVLGSGWSGLRAQIVEPVVIPYDALAGFPPVTVQGHAGELVLGRIGGVEVALLAGRKHAYETGRADAMKLPLRVLRALGCDVLLQTNAAGSLDPAMGVGSLMLLEDHINFTQLSPLLGDQGCERFVSLVDAYDPGLRAIARDVARTRGVALHQGVYAWCIGPQFETPAEIRMYRLLGAHAVGMSTVPETIIARHAGMKVLAISLLTNLAAGLDAEPMSHEHTLSSAAAAAEMAGSFLGALIGALATGLD